MIKIENLTKTYGDGETKVTALKNINFSIRKGEFVSIIGPSGSGKSTLLLTIGGLIQPTEGKVYIDNQSIYDFSVTARALIRQHVLGFMFQTFNLIPYLSALANKPSIILADEPTGNLDPACSQEVFDYFSQLNMEGYTIVMVTHDHNAAGLARRQFEIVDGRVVSEINN